MYSSSNNPPSVSYLGSGSRFGTTLGAPTPTYANKNWEFKKKFIGDEMVMNQSIEGSLKDEKIGSSST